MQERAPICLWRNAIPASTGHISYRRFAPGDGSRLVQNHSPHLVGPLQCLAVLEQNALLCTNAGANHDGRWRCQSQRTGAGDDQHSHHVDHALGKAHAAKDEPGEEGDQGHADHHRHKDPRDPVGQPLDRRLRALGLFHQADDLSQRRLGAHAGRLELEQALLVDGPAHNLIARPLVNRQALAGEHRLVHRRAALDDDAIHRQPLAGPDHHQVAQHHRLHGYLDLATVAHHLGRLGTQPHQLLDRFRGSALGPGLQHLAQLDQGDDHGRGLEIYVAAQAREEQDSQTVKVRRRRAHRHQHVHVG